MPKDIYRKQCPRLACGKKHARKLSETDSRINWLCLKCGTQWREDKQGLEAGDASVLRSLLGQGPLALRYGRISSPCEDSLSKPKQDSATKKYWETRLACEGVGDAGFWFDDTVSARNIPFLERTYARELFDYSRPGDHVIVQYLTRGWRNTVDCLKTCRLFKSKGVTVHIMDLNVDTSAPSGELMLTVYAGVAQFESDCISLRTREDIAARRAANIPASGKAPIGWRIDTVNGKRRFVPDEEERKMAMWILNQQSQGVPRMEIWKKLANVPSKTTDGHSFGHIANLIRAAKDGFPSAKEKWNSPKAVEARQRKQEMRARRRLG